MLRSREQKADQRLYKFREELRNAQCHRTGSCYWHICCSRSHSPGIRTGKCLETGLINAKADAGIVLMVSTRDFAKNRGLKIEISQFKDDQLALKSLIAGELDSFEGGPQGVFAADAKGADVKLLGCHWIVVPHGIYANEKIAKVQDLKGKQIA